MDKDITLTPMMKQFLDLKAKHPDAVMLFRCGDFYETYSTDAVVASEILGITLTKRNNGKGGQTIEMAGFPHHALDTYLPKLIRAGRRVAICDQLEDPKLAKKLVKRGITELVTPGVAINDNVLNYKENNFLAAVHFGRSACGVAFLDISTGEFYAAEGSDNYVDKLIPAHFNAVAVHKFSQPVIVEFFPPCTLFFAETAAVDDQSFGTGAFPVADTLCHTQVKRKRPQNSFIRLPLHREAPLRTECTKSRNFIRKLDMIFPAFALQRVIFVSEGIVFFSQIFKFSHSNLHSGAFFTIRQIFFQKITNLLFAISYKKFAIRAYL